MIISFSTALGVKKADFKRLGILDAVIGIDTRLFLDPFLLKRTRIPEFRQSRQKIEKYYQDVITLLVASRSRGDIAWRKALRLLTFRELQGVSIGYGVHTGNGSAIGPGLAAKLITTATEILGMGIKDPAIFELLGLFEEDFGADRLSDMTIAVIREDIFRFTERVSKELNIRNLIDIQFRGQKFQLPKNPAGKGFLVLLPKSLLSPLPVAMDWSGIEHVVAHNEQLRSRLNQLIGSAWKNKITKGQLKQVIFSSPANIERVLATYKNNEPIVYNYKIDPASETSWYSTGEEFARKYPVELAKKVSSLSELWEVVAKIVEQFKRNIESNNLKQHLYVPDGYKLKPRHERYAQHLFYAIADIYCQANNLDVSREPNAGNGPVDFKISQGHEAKVVVEMKLSSNPKLIQGFEKQLPAYQESEGTQSSFYVVIRITESDKQIKELLKLSERLDKERKKHPEIIVIDGTIKPSASKRR